jgi:hypothetical protein
MAGKKKSQKPKGQQQRQRGQTRSTPVAASNAVVTNRGPRVPKVMSSNDSWTVCNSEVLFTQGSSSTAGNFLAQSYYLIPSNFPWLATIANSFSKYRWKYLELIYTPRQGTNTGGIAYLALQYDTMDSIPGSGASLSQISGASYGVVSAGQGGSTVISNPMMRRMVVDNLISTVVDVDRLDTKWYKYVSSSRVASLTSNDQAAFVPAMLIYGSEGLGGVTVSIGAITAKYCIELIEPIPGGLNP